MADKLHFAAYTNVEKRIVEKERWLYKYPFFMEIYSKIDDFVNPEEGDENALSLALLNDNQGGINKVYGGVDKKGKPKYASVGEVESHFKTNAHYLPLKSVELPSTGNEDLTSMRVKTVKIVGEHITVIFPPLNDYDDEDAVFLLRLRYEEIVDTLDQSEKKRAWIIEHSSIVQNEPESPVRNEPVVVLPQRTDPNPLTESDESESSESSEDDLGPPPVTVGTTGENKKPTSTPNRGGKPGGTNIYFDALVTMANLLDDLRRDNPTTETFSTNWPLVKFINTFNYVHCSEIRPAGHGGEPIKPIYMEWDGEATRLLSVAILNERFVMYFGSESGERIPKIVSEVATEIGATKDTQRQLSGFINRDKQPALPYMIDYRNVFPLYGYIVRTIAGVRRYGVCIDTNGLYKCVSKRKTGAFDDAIYWEIDERYVPAFMTYDEDKALENDTDWQTNHSYREMLRHFLFTTKGDISNLEEILFTKTTIWENLYLQPAQWSTMMKDLQENAPAIYAKLNPVSSRLASPEEQQVIIDKGPKSITEVDEAVLEVEKTIQDLRNRLEASEKKYSALAARFKSKLNYFTEAFQVANNFIDNLGSDDDWEEYQEALQVVKDAERVRNAKLGLQNKVDAGLQAMITSSRDVVDVSMAREEFNKLLRSNVYKGKFKIDFKVESDAGEGTATPVLDMSFNHVNTVVDPENNRAKYGTLFKQDLRPLYRIGGAVPNGMGPVIPSRGIITLTIQNEKGEQLKKRQMSYQLDATKSEEGTLYLIHASDVDLYVRSEKNITKLKTLVVDV